jgi:hypothetical protein
MLVFFTRARLRVPETGKHEWGIWRQWKKWKICVRIVASGRKSSLPTPKGNGMMFCMYFLGAVIMFYSVPTNTHHKKNHHQHINVSTAGAQAYLMDYPQEERAVTYHAGPVWISGCKRLQIQPGPMAKRTFRSTKELEIINFWSPIRWLINVA